MTRKIDMIAVAELLGYTAGEANSIRDIRISGNEHQVTVTRYVQDPGSLTPRKVLDFRETDAHDGPARTNDPIVIDDIFRYDAIRPAPSDPFPQPVYVGLSRTVVAALKRQQWD